MVSSNDKSGNIYSNNANTHDTTGAEDPIIIFCDLCGNSIDSCSCVCPYCGEREGCTCCLFDASTGGG